MAHARIPPPNQPPPNRIATPARSICRHAHWGGGERRPVGSEPVQYLHVTIPVAGIIGAGGRRSGTYCVQPARGHRRTPSRSHIIRRRNSRPEGSRPGRNIDSLKKADLTLQVTPQITPDDQIILNLEINKDSRGMATLCGLAINTKHVKTQVQVEKTEPSSLVASIRRRCATTRPRFRCSAIFRHWETFSEAPEKYTTRLNCLYS